jgi:mRNA-degrading endonuclease toxin of MazEF toxin-antitoxin module
VRRRRPAAVRARAASARERGARALLLRTPDKANATFLATLAVPLTDLHPDYPALLLAQLHVRLRRGGGCGG